MLVTQLINQSRVTYVFHFLVELGLCANWISWLCAISHIGGRLIKIKQSILQCRFYFILNLIYDF